MQIIKNNPYRTVGLLVGASAREQQRQVNRLKQFIAAEQEPQDDFSFPILGKLNRTIESVNDAASKLNLDCDKIDSALFWFYKGSDVYDEPAFNFLKEVRLQYAIDIWEKLVASGEVTQRNCSAFHNLSTLLLCNAFSESEVNVNLFEQAVSLKLRFLESDYIKDFIAIATDETYRTSKKELQLLFLNQVHSEVDLIGGISSNKFLEIINKHEFSGKEEFLKGFVQKPIEQIEKQIEETKTKRKANKANAFSLGKALYEKTSETLNQLKSILGTTSIKFTSISDKVSDEILQCGIDYFSNYKDSNTDPGSQSMDLFKKAKSLAFGNIAKQRCQENTDNLQEWINDKPEREIQRRVGGELDFIIKYLNLAVATLKNKGKYPRGYDDPYSDLPLHEQPHNIIPNSQTNIKNNSHFIPIQPIVSPLDYFNSKNEFNVNLFRLSRDIVRECKPKLDTIKSNFGPSNEIYQKLSNEIVSIALACLIEYVNGQSNPILNLPPNVNEIEINAMIAIGELDMNFEMRKRYNDQKQALYNLQRAAKKTYSSQRSSGNCYIATMAYGDYDHPQVLVLRQFRDDFLSKSIFGRCFIKVYYRYSPKLVEKMKNNVGINRIIRKTLNQFIKLIK